MATLSGSVFYPCSPRIGEQFGAYIEVVGSGPTRSTRYFFPGPYLITDIAPGYVQITAVTGDCGSKPYAANTFLAAGTNHWDIYLVQR